MQREAFQQFVELERDHWWFRGRRRVYLELVARALGDARPARTLDQGCGVGGFLEGLSALSERVVGFEHDREAAAHCRDRGFARIARSSAERIPARDRSFDLVCLFDVLEHLDDDLAALREAERVLAPGGRCVASVPAFQFLYANNDRVAEHRRRYTRGELVERFRAAGFEIERATYTNVLLFAPIVCAVLALKAWERVVPRKRDARHTNLTWGVPRAFDGFFYRCFAAELVLSRRFDLPLGHSLLVIARKR
ncbi:MAG: class I SAM-dependent methyltransferase [Planctomycetes bacterium]|nr:class I SAM-dependent methyltransferase [Planctomycetota bacterium]